MMSRDLRGPEATRKWRLWPEITWSGRRRPKTRVKCTFHLQGCSSQLKGVTWQELTSWDLRWPEVTRKWRHFTVSYPEVAVEGQKLAYTVHFTFYKAVSQLEEVTWPKIMSHDLRWPKVTRKWSHFTRGCLQLAVEGRKLASTVHFSTYKAVTRSRGVTRQEMTSHDLRWPKATRNWRHLTGSHL